MFDTYWYDYSDCNDINELINRAIASSRTEYIWLRHRAVDYSNFNLRIMPSKHQAQMLHAWPSHDNPRCYTTWLIPINNNGNIVYHDNDILPINAQPPWNTSAEVLYDGFNFNWYPDVWDWDKQHHFAMNGTTQLSYTSVGNGKEAKYYTSNLQFKAIGIWYDIDNIADSPYEWNWIVDNRIDYTDFNWSWLPDAWDSNKIHEFCMYGADQLSYTRLMRRGCTNERVYHHSYLVFKDIPKVTTHNLTTDSEWVWVIDERIDYSNFNFNWLPPAWDINKTHAFAMNGTEQLCYTFLHNTKNTSIEIKYHDAKLKFDPLKPNDEWVWIKDERIDYTNFDFTWLPDVWDADKTHVFCMAGTQQLGYTKLINTKNKNPKTIYHPSNLHFLPQVRPVIYWQDYTHTFNLETLKTLAMGNEWTWIADRRIDYSAWDFEWLPDGWDTNYIHAFTMEGKEQLSYTVLIHRDAIRNFIDYKYHKSQLRFNDEHADLCFLNTNTFENNLKLDFTVRLITTMEESLKAAVKKSKREWLWIYSDVVQYDEFDWNWLPDLDQREQIHCWPSGNCQKGDTFLIHVPSFNEDKLKFNFEHESLKRKRWPVVSVTDNCLAWDLNNYPRSRGIYAVYSYTGFVDYPDVCLWDKRPVVSLNRSNSTCLVPRDCVVNKEIYEYPYLLRYPEYGIDIPIDIIFIDNNESCAEDNWNRLLSIHPNAKSISGINNRLEAYRAAAFQSDTPWFIAVFAKCHLLDNFAELNWQPDFWQEPKHYIFHNRNLNTGLEYGHMAPIAYHCKLMYENKGGLDVTLAQRHTTVPITISETNLENDDWLTWRTAFREVIKILHFNKENLSIENQYRLWAWRNVANGSNADIQKLAVKHAEEYYVACGGNEDALILTSEWDWLYAHYTCLIPQIKQF